MTTLDWVLIIAFVLSAIATAFLHDKQLVQDENGDWHLVTFAIHRELP